MKTFDFNTINDFDNHISASITGYDLLHSLIVNVSSFFIKKDTVPVDLGCTTGKLLIEVHKRYGVKCAGFDITDSNYLNPSSEDISLLVADISADSFDVPKTDLLYLVFTLQFLSVKNRLPLLKKCYSALEKGGALIVCEKELSKDGAIQEVFTFSNYQNTRLNFSNDEILEKEEKLRHTMTNLTACDNLELFKAAGFKVVEPFFQSLNFKGYILKK